MTCRAWWCVGLACAGWLGMAHAQSVINWGAGRPAPTPAPAATAPVVAEHPLVPVPVPPPLPPPAPLVDTGSMAGYVQKEGPEPSVRLDGQVSPALKALYAQRPGESEDAYVARMGALYRKSQAELQATEARNEAYIRSLAAPAKPAAQARSGQ